jgi:hypothetical protein
VTAIILLKVLLLLLLTAQARDLSKGECCLDGDQPKTRKGILAYFHGVLSNAMVRLSARQTKKDVTKKLWLLVIAITMMQQHCSSFSIFFCVCGEEPFNLVVLVNLVNSGDKIVEKNI